MKKNKIITKTMKILLISIISFTINTEEAYCGVENVLPAIPQVSYNPSSGDAYVEGSGCGLYRSSVSIASDINTRIEITAYDKEGNDILNSNGTIDLKNAIKAGTWIGINVNEIHEAYYSASVTSYEVKYSATCFYSQKYIASTTPIPCPGNKNKTCGSSPNYGYRTVTKGSSNLNKCEKDSYECPPAGYWETPTGGPKFTEYQVAAGGYQSGLQSRVENFLDNIAYNYVNQNVGKIKYIPVNDYDKYEMDELTLHASGIDSSTKNGKKGYVQSYTYSPNKICIDLKNGDVTYKESECKLSENKIEIKNKIAKDGKEYWHYFVPLDIKSNQNFSIDVEGDKIFTTEQCINYINENKDDYFKFIKPVSNKIIMPSTNNEKDRKKFIEEIKKAAGTIKKRLEDEGCVYKTGINIPIIQRFYNEYENNETIGFKGFNFYYKPIDVNNPFPNSLTDTSIWYDWYNENKKQPDLTKSFNKKTYAVDVGNNGDVIRNYTTKDLPYTTWQNMKLNGTSSFIDFIETYGIGKRIDKQVNKTYKLGCSSINEKPTNEDGSKNYLYVDWCDNS